MSLLQKGKELAREMINKHPEHADEITELYDLFVSEIEAGESVYNEFCLFQDSVEQLIGEEDE